MAETRKRSAEPREAALDRLYGAPLAEFTRSRNRVAAELARAGHAEAAEEVRRLAKPSAVVWAVNQLARRDRVGIERLLQTGDRLRAAQGAAGAEMAEAAAAHRRALDHLRDQARTVLGEAGHAGSDALMERLTATLLGAASDPAALEDLRRGRLADERARPGFEVLAGAAPARPAPAPHRAAAARDDARRVALERRLEAARTVLGSAEAEAARRGERAEEAERAAGEARRAATAAQQAATDAARAVRAIEADLRRAR
jgi:hypothetical protein